MNRSDVIVYGATPAGVGAAWLLGSRGASVLLLAQGSWIGGMLSNGICTAETENMDAGPSALAGAATEFTRRVGFRYGFDRPLYYWEPHVAEEVMWEMCDEAGVRVETDAILREVTVRGNRIESLVLKEGHIFEARLFLDCSYEGDLMAAAGVSYTFGRESIEHYGESLAGVRFIDSPDEAAPNTTSRITYIDEVQALDPFWPDGSILDGVADGSALALGDASPLTMNYNFRPTLSTGADRVPFPRPPRYDPSRFELLRRWIASRDEFALRDVLDLYPHPSREWEPRAGDWRWQASPGSTWELNNKQSAVISIGHFGAQRGWPDGSDLDRKAIFDDHRDYTLGLLHFLATDRAVPRAVRDELSGFGLAAGEFTSNGNWPRELYVREARRMVGLHVLTQRDLLDDCRKSDAILRGTHKIDSHHVQRVTVPGGFRNEGRIWFSVKEPYDIPYRSLVPRTGECDNLIVPVALSASHVAFCSLRLEMVWMSLAHAAASAALLALSSDLPVQEVDRAQLQAGLRSDGFDL